MANIKELILSIESTDSSFEEKLAAITEMQATVEALQIQEEQAVQDNVDLIVEALKTIEAKVEAKLKEIPEKGEQGIQGPKGEKGDRGLDGAQGKDGLPGRDGKDGLDGRDGVGVQDAKIDFDGSLVITLTDGREINVGEVVPVDVAENIHKVTHSIQSGSGGDSQTTLNAIAALQATIATYGTMATQNANNVAITGGAINNTTIGATTPSTGVFTTLTGNTTFQFGKSSANYGQGTGGATTKAVEFKALGSDTNVALALRSQGTGAIDLAAGSSGVNISNGGTVTAITRTAGGNSYTSATTPAISAPTTAGGVQATATANMGMNGNPIVTAGGTGYTLNDILTVSGGTYTAQAQLQVTGVSGGVITAVAVVNNVGSYTVIPTSPFSVTGGTGSSATFTLTNWSVQSLNITNAGSGYVEQPTVTFSGGGGSGAAAYATVGGTTTIKTVGVSALFNTPGGPAFSIYDTQRTTVDYWEAVGSTGTVGLRVAGASANNNGIVSSKGTGYVSLQTNSFNQEQLRVSHTASAVNYVQVTGAATGSTPILYGTGSDTNVSTTVSTKGFSSFINFTASGTTDYKAFAVSTSGASNTGNYFQVKGNASGTGPVLSAEGTDANINAVLQPKGTGALQAQQTDSTATGGNARGANAVDWQTSRASASQVASGVASVISGGINNTSGGNYNFVGGGQTNTANFSFGGVASGASNTVSGNYSFIGGGNNNSISNNAVSNYSFIGSGALNTAHGIYNVTVGGQTNSGTSASAVTTQSGTMNATTAVTLSGSNASIKVGQYISGTSIAANTYVAAISGTSLTLSQAASGSSTSTLSFYTPHGVVVGGGNNQATGAYSFIGGGGDAGTAANRNVASGDYSFVGGGVKNVASGYGAVICGGGTYGTIVGNTASGVGSFVASGWGNQATSTVASVLGGAYGISSGTYSTIINGQLATTRGIGGYAVYSALNPFSSTQGGSQGAILIIAKQTTDATPSVLTSDATAGNTTNQVILPNNSAYYFRGEVISGVTGGGNTKGWTIEGVIKRGANAASTTLVGSTVTSMYADAGAVTWTIALSADTTNGGLAVTFTGQAATTIRTVCRLNTTEMTY